LIREKSTTSERLLKRLPFISKLSSSELSQLSTFISNDVRDKVELTTERNEAFVMGSPVLVPLFLKSFRSVQKRFGIRSDHFELLLRCWLIRKHCDNFSGYIHSGLLATLYGGPIKSFQAKLAYLRRMGYISLVTDKQYIKDSELNRLTKIYSVSEVGREVVTFFSKSMQKSMINYSLSGGRYNHDIREMNFTQEYLFALKCFFNGDRYSFVECDYHNTHPELHLAVPNYRQYLTDVIAEAGNSPVNALKNPKLRAKITNYKKFYKELMGKSGTPKKWRIKNRN